MSRQRAHVANSNGAEASTGTSAAFGAGPRQPFNFQATFKPFAPEQLSPRSEDWGGPFLEQRAQALPLEPPQTGSPYQQSSYDRRLVASRTASSGGADHGEVDFFSQGLPSGMNNVPSRQSYSRGSQPLPLPAGSSPWLIGTNHNNHNHNSPGLHAESPPYNQRISGSLPLHAAAPGSSLFMQSSNGASSPRSIPSMSGLSLQDLILQQPSNGYVMDASPPTVHRGRHVYGTAAGFGHSVPTDGRGSTSSLDDSGSMGHSNSISSANSIGILTSSSVHSLDNCKDMLRRYSHGSHISPYGDSHRASAPTWGNAGEVNSRLARHSEPTLPATIHSNHSSHSSNNNNNNTNHNTNHSTSHNSTVTSNANNSSNSSASALSNEISVDAIDAGLETRVTVMLRNIPNKLGFDDLKRFLDATNSGTYDFLYLRFDFGNRCNVGYAFISFIRAEHVATLVRQRAGLRWSRYGYNSEKVIEIKYARIQGRDNLVEKFRNSPVMAQDPAFHPRLYYSSGPLAGLEEPFPSRREESK